MSDICVAYWSGTGNTEAMAQAIGAGITAAAFRSGYESIFKILRIHTVCGRRCFGFIQKALLRQPVYNKGFST